MAAFGTVRGRGLDKDLPATPIDPLAPRVTIRSATNHSTDEGEDGELQHLPSTPRPGQHLETSPITLQGYSPPESTAYLTPLGDSSHESPTRFHHNSGRGSDSTSSSPRNPKVNVKDVFSTNNQTTISSSPTPFLSSSHSEGTKLGLGVVTDLITSCSLSGLLLPDLPDPMLSFDLSESGESFNHCSTTALSPSTSYPNTASSGNSNSSINNTTSSTTTTMPNNVNSCSSSSSGTPACFSDVSSARFSVSTRASIWTEKSQSSTATSPSTSAILKADSPVGGNNDARDDFNGAEAWRLGNFSMPTADNTGANRAAAVSPDGMAATREHRAISAGSLRHAETASLSGPFAHHRAPSWTRQTSQGGSPTPVRTNSQHRLMMHNRQVLDDLSSSPSLSQQQQQNTVVVPNRVASRSRTHSDTSKARPGSARSNRSTLTNGSESIESQLYSCSSIDSNINSAGNGLVGRRTSSLRRPTAKDFPMPPKTPPMPPLHRRQASRDKLDGCVQPGQLRHKSSHSGSSAASSLANGRRTAAAATALPDSFFCSANSYGLTMANAGKLELFQFRDDVNTSSDLSSSSQGRSADSSLAIRAIEEGCEQIVDGKGRRAAEEVEENISHGTSHLLLAGCGGVDGSFLLRTLSLATDSLLVLDVSACAITSLPSCLARCHVLEELNVSHNALTGNNPLALVGQIATLRVLLAESCGLRGLPKSLACLQRLQILSVRHNYLTHIPSWLHRLGSLEALLLQDNTFHRTWREITTLLADSPDSSCCSTISGDDERFMKERSLSEATTASSGTERSFAAADDEVEELDEAEVLNYARMRSEADESSRATSSHHAHGFKPLMRRMRSNNDMYRVSDDRSAGSGGSAMASPSREGTENPRATATDADSAGYFDQESGWGLFKRKLLKKASVASLNSSASSLHLGTKTRSNSLVHLSHGSSDRLDVATLGDPATLRGSPLQAGGGSKDSLSAAGRPPLSPFGDGKFVATSDAEQQAFKTFLQMAWPWDDAAGPDAYHQERRKHIVALRSLMAYLRDLDDLTPPSPRQSYSGGPDATNMSPGWRSSPTSPGPQTVSLDPMRVKPPVALLPRSTSASAVPQHFEGEKRLSIKDDSVRRLKIVREIVGTEQTYLRGLSELVDIYVKPAKLIDPNSGTPWIAPTEHRRVFGDIEGIMQFHQGAFLPLLEAAVAPLRSDEVDQGTNAELTASVAEEVAKVFLRHHAFLRMYSSYVNNVDASQHRITAWMSQSSGQAQLTSGATGKRRVSNASGSSSNAKEPWQQEEALGQKERKRIQAFMHRARKDRRHSQFSLESYLLLPVQRIPRYRLLLEDLARSTPVERLQDQTSVKAALEAISTIASSMNESKRQSEKDRRLLNWQARIRPIRGSSLNQANGRVGQDSPWPSPLVQPHRRLVLDGQVILKRVVERTAAFHAPAESVWAEEEEGDALASIGQRLSLAEEISDRDEAWQNANRQQQQQKPRRMVQVDRLEQTIQQRPLTLIVCNDICVAVVTNGDPSGPVDLYAIWRLRELPSSDGSPPVTIVGQTVLRIVDTKRILYCQASSIDEAENLRDALLQQVAHHQ